MLIVPSKYYYHKRHDWIIYDDDHVYRDMLYIFFFHYIISFISNQRRTIFVYVHVQTFWWKSIKERQYLTFCIRGLFYKTKRRLSFDIWDSSYCDSQRFNYTIWSHFQYPETKNLCCLEIICMFKILIDMSIFYDTACTLSCSTGWSCTSWPCTFHFRMTDWIY